MANERILFMKGQETELSKAQCQESVVLGTRFLVMSLNYDYIYSLDHIVAPGETIASAKLDKACGGKGLLTRLQLLQKAGAKVYLAGLVGSDGGELLETAQEFGVDCRFVQERDNATGHAIIQVDKTDRTASSCLAVRTGCGRRNRSIAFWILLKKEMS